jgi:hypothetical protein
MPVVKYSAQCPMTITRSTTKEQFELGWIPVNAGEMIKSVMAIHSYGRNVPFLYPDNAENSADWHWQAVQLFVLEHQFQLNSVSFVPINITVGTKDPASDQNLI